jgi:hypothetical protein
MLKWAHQVVAWILLLALMLSQLPFAALHQHAEESGICFNAHHHHTVEEQGCKIATTFDGQKIPGKCEHPQHIQEVQVHCKVCAFEFIKVYEKPTCVSMQVFHSVIMVSETVHANDCFIFPLSNGGRAPPALV